MGNAQNSPEGGQTGAHRLSFSLVYDELHRMAHRQLQGERQDHTFATTDLVHEAWLRLAPDTGAEPTTESQFLALASSAMRRVLIDYARRHQAAKRGGGDRPVTLDETMVAAEEQSGDLVALDDALSRLATLDERLARVVECRYFGGLTEEETAGALGVTARTVRRDWVKAKAWLYRELHSREP